MQSRRVVRVFAAVAAVTTALLCAVALVDAYTPVTHTFTFSVQESIVDFYSPTADPYAIPPEANKLARLVNAQFPGPAIEVMHGDIVSINVINYMHEPTSIHWHGLDQRGTPYYDGVPGITQCLIQPGENFTYIFHADPPGTRLWHAHHSAHSEDGMAGAFIIHPQEEPLAALYSHEKVILVNDWYRDAMLAGFFKRSAGRTLVNGHWGDGSDRYPYPLIEVNAGACYRFRWIYAGGENPGYNVRIAGHNVTIVSLDGYDIVPTAAGGFIFSPGERVDTIFCADQVPGNYLINIDTIHAAEGMEPVWAFIHYNGSEIPRDLNGTGGGENAKPAGPEEAWAYTAHDQFLAADYVPPPPTGAAARVITLPASIARGGRVLTPPDFYGFSLAPDYITSVLGETPVIQTRGLSCLKDQQHVFQIYNESVVDIIVNMENHDSFVYAEHHPMHIHGMGAWVLGTGPKAPKSDQNPLFYYPSLADRAAACGHALDSDGNCQYNAAYDYAKLNFVNPPFKDTTGVMTASWIYLRVVANNPGPWLFHCHLADHMNGGMHVTFNVMPYSQPSLPSNFKECGQCGRTDACEYCSSSSSTSSGCTSTSSYGSASNVVNINFANMFNGFTP